jgi:DNA-binding transcriptional LysR family regulator
MGNTKTPPLRLLRAFCFAARHASFKTAADRLALSPSAVSHQMKDLEEQLGVTLFQRRTRSVELTATGRQLLEDLEPALESLAAAIARATRSPAARRQLHVVMPPFFASEFFAPRLPDFHDRHPQVDISVDTSDPRPGQHSSRSDVSILLSDREPDVGFDAVRLFPLRLVAACSREFAAALEHTGLEALEQQTLVMHRLRPHAWERWMRDAGLDLARVRNIVEFDTMIAVARAAETGAGVAMVPDVLCQPWFDNGSLVKLPSLEIETGDAYYLVARSEDIARPEVQALSQWMLEQFQLNE